MSDSRTCSRPIQSCYQCRKRKIKCNRAYPCAPCLLRGEGDVCREVDRNHSSSGKTTVETLDEVVHRVSVLERAVTRLSKLLPPEIITSGLEEAETPTSRASNKHRHSVSTSTNDSVVNGNANDAEKPTSAIRSSYGSGSTDEDVAMMLEDFAMGHRVNRSRATQNLECDPSDSISNSTPAYASQDGLLAHEYYDRPMHSIPTPGSTLDGFVPQFGLPARHPLALLIDPSTNVVGRLVSALPSQSQCMTLVHFYFERLEWYSKVLHAPSFLSDVNHLMDQVSIATLAPDHPNPDVSALAHVSIPFLSVFFMVLCLSLHLIEPVICHKLDISFEEATEFSRKMYNAAQACFHVGDFLGNHSLEALQCLILMGVYQQNLDEADSHWALLGSAIKIAQNLGISRLGSECENRKYSGIWSSVVKREIARRVWWSLIFNDWSHAAAHNGAYSVQPSQNHTGFPANINDADLVDGLPLKGRPLTQYTEMTLSLTRFRFVEIYREIVDNMQAPTGYGFITKMDAKLRKMQEDIPQYFQESGDSGCETATTSFRGHRDVKRLELTLCLLMGETRQLRLHRPYLFKGYKDRKYAGSREQCINSARAILHLLKSNDEQSAILLKWWMVLFYGFAASVVLFIDLCHHKADNDPNLEFRRAELREALDLFKTVEHISSVSRNAIALLEGLMSVEPEISSKQSRKRRGSSPEGDEPFRKVVKRMIIDAKRNTESPTAQSSDSQGSPSNAHLSPLSPTNSNATLHRRSGSGSSLPRSNFSPVADYAPRISIPVHSRNSSSSSEHSPWISSSQTYPSPYQQSTSSNALLLTTSEYDQGRSGGSSSGDMGSGSPLSLGWGLPGRDMLAPAILFRESGMFEAGMRELDEVTMNELGQLLWNADSYSFGETSFNGGGWSTS